MEPDSPCLCPIRAARNESTVESAMTVEFFPPLDDSCQHSTLYVDGAPVATVQRKRVLDRSIYEWRAYGIDGTNLWNFLRTNPERMARQILKCLKYRHTANPEAEADSQEIHIIRDGGKAKVTVYAMRNGERADLPFDVARFDNKADAIAYAHERAATGVARYGAGNSDIFDHCPDWQIASANGEY